MMVHVRRRILAALPLPMTIASEPEAEPVLFSVESVNVRLGWTADEAAEAERRAKAEIEAAKGAGKGSAKAPSGAAEGSDSSRQAPLFDDL